MRTILEANSRPGCTFDILSNPGKLFLHYPVIRTIAAFYTHTGERVPSSFGFAYA